MHDDLETGFESTTIAERDLGVYADPEMTFKTHITNTIRKANQIRLVD